MIGQFPHFRPLQSFLDWATETFIASNPQNLPTIEIGCGAHCELVRKLGRMGIPILGVDPIFPMFDIPVPLDVVNRILPTPAEAVDLLSSTPANVLVCRPCHNQFPYEVLKKLHPESRFYYVGLIHNLDVDFPIGEVQFELLLAHIGEDAECLWEVTRL